MPHKTFTLVTWKIGWIRLRPQEFVSLNYGYCLKPLRFPVSYS